MTAQGSSGEGLPPGASGGGSRKRSDGVFILLSVLGIQFLVTALVFLPSAHTGGDNAGYVTLAHSLLERGEYLELWDPTEPPHTKYPPVFPLLLALPMALGVKGWVGLKVVPFLSTLLAGAFAFLWARGRGGNLMAAGVVLLFALSDGILYYSRWILSDPTFLALTLGALWALERGERGGGGASRHLMPEGRGVSAPSSLGYLAMGFVLVILAYFTRSAGLPLVVATMVWLGLRRWWRPLAVFVLAFGLPALLWWARGRAQGGSAYAAEFWLIDPYRPELGRAGVTGLAARVWENLLRYVTDFIPEGIVGMEGWFLLPFGVVLVFLALLGWGKSAKKGLGVAELFLPFYGGLMCLWPVVWSGDRFALPLLPPLLFFAASALAGLTRRIPPYRRIALLLLAFSLAGVPALGNLAREARSARNCRELVKEGGPWACYGVSVREYILMAQWTRENLPEDAVVVTRKPRIFHLMSGVKAVSLPLTIDSGEFFSLVGEKGARYLTLDRWDGLSGYYLPKVMEEAPGSFCYLTGVEVGRGVGIQLLGIVPEGEGGREGLQRCPEGMVGSGRERMPLPTPWEVPLLVRSGRS